MLEVWNIDNIIKRFILLVILLLSHRSLFTRSSSVGGFCFSRGCRDSPPAENPKQRFLKMLSCALFPSIAKRFPIVPQFYDLSRKQRNSLYKPIKSVSLFWTSGNLFIPLLVQNKSPLWNITTSDHYVVFVFWLWKITMKHFYKTVFVFEREQWYIGGHCLCFAFNFMWFGGFTTQWSSFWLILTVLGEKGFCWVSGSTDEYMNQLVVVYCRNFTGVPGWNLKGCVMKM